MSKQGKVAVIYGIQGGTGSFNEEALQYYLKRNGHTVTHTKYLYTSENVLTALENGEITYGQFALHNSTGGIVQESIEAMGRHRFEVVDQYAIIIKHALMKRKDVAFHQVTAIMTHPQVLRQCRQTLDEKYPMLKQLSGEGELIDHARVAERLSQGMLDKHFAVMGSSILAELYDLDIVEDNLQDNKENYTSFLLVRQPDVTSEVIVR